LIFSIFSLLATSQTESESESNTGGAGNRPWWGALHVSNSVDCEMMCIALLCDF